jgi:PEP-CTERM motif
MKKSLLSGFASAVLFSGMAFTGSASAALTFSSCIGTDPAYNIASKVTPNSGCTIADADQDLLNPLTVNETPGFFDFTDWIFDGKWNSPDKDKGETDFTDDSDLYNFTGDAQRGTFTRDYTLPADFSDVMFVVKDGQGTTLVGYLISTATESGSYFSPFTNPPFTDANGATATDAKDISHISVYYRGEGGTGGECLPGIPLGSPECLTVPEPGALSLAALGLFAAGWASRRRKVM